MNYRLIPLVAALAAILFSCSGSKEPSALIAQADRLNSELNQLADESPMFLDSVKVDYADATLSVKIAFSDTIYSVNDFNDALVQYTTAAYMKSHAGENLDIVVNTITAEKGKLAVTLIDRKGESKTFDISDSRLRQLVKLKPMEISYNDARQAATDIMGKRAAGWAEAIGADGWDFGVVASFAEYTFWYPNNSTYRNLKQPQLTGRYVAVLKPIYEDFGACRPMIEDLLKSFQIDGYRFVYTDKSEKNVLKAPIPWRLIN